MFSTRIYFFLLYVVFQLSCLAQGGFVKRHFPKGLHNSVCRDVFEAPDGNIIGIGITTDSILGGGRLSILGMDKNGNQKWIKSYGHPNMYFYDNDVHLRGPALYDSSGFYVLLLAGDTVSPRTFGVLMKFDYNGDTLWSKEYRSSHNMEDVMPQAMCRSRDGGFFFTGLFQYWVQPKYSRCLIIKTNSKGEKLWEQKIGKAIPDVQDGKSIVQDSATGRIIIAGYQYIGSSTYWTRFGNIIITDSLGTKLHQTTYNNSNGGGFLEVIQLKDKNFLSCGSYNANSQLGNLRRYYSFVVKFDTAGTMIWAKKYDIISPVSHIALLHELPNGDLILAGSLDTMLNHNLPPDWRVKVIRTDKDGNIKWRKNVGSGIKDEIPISIHPTEDKGFLLSLREMYSSAPNPFNIVKIDSTGCDTLEAHCKLEELLAGVPEHSLDNLFSLYPNPALDNVHIQISSEIRAPSQLLISDVEGRVIKSVDLKENDLTLDVYDLRPGVYVVKLSDNKRILQSSKLVILR